jgi:adenosine deaminase
MSMNSIPTKEQIKVVPKVMLHDHLDGGLRPQTIIDIAQEIGYTALPTHDAAELATWFRESCDSGSLVRYLETFSHTIAVMQRREDIVRVARECALDLARDGVVYAEVRGAPELFTEKGLSMSDVVEATLEGYKLGMQEAKAEGFTIEVRSLLCGMRQNKRSQEVAELVVKYRDKGVVGFDIAGPEDGVRIIDDIDFSGPEPKLGRLAAYVRDRRIPLELCPTSNLQTGAAASYAEHPIGALAKLRFRVTLNTDNRLMSQTSLSFEMEEAVKAFGWDFAELQRVTINAMKSAFIPYPERLAIIDQIIKPGYAKVSAGS